MSSRPCFVLMSECLTVFDLELIACAYLELLPNTVLLQSVRNVLQLHSRYASVCDT